jgi:hypothetical protein
MVFIANFNAVLYSFWGVLYSQSSIHLMIVFCEYKNRSFGTDYQYDFRNQI